MKKKILALGAVMALVVVMALPMAVFADTGGTDVTGTLVPTFTLAAPSSFALGTAGVLAVGANTGVSATPGSVITNVAGWTLGMSAGADDFMKISVVGVGGTGTIGDPLANAILVGMTGGTLSVSGYQTQLRAVIDTYSKTGTFDIPLSASQTVLATDAAGTYSITLTYTATPGS